MISKVFNNSLLGIIGFILSAYSVYVEHKVDHKDDNPEEQFSALCDIEVRLLVANHVLCDMYIAILSLIYLY